MQNVDRRDDQPKTGLADTDHLAEPEQHPLLVLLDDLDGHQHGREQNEHDDDHDAECGTHDDQRSQGERRTSGWFDHQRAEESPAGIRGWG